MTRFFKNSENPIFGPFSHFWGKLFLENSALPRTTSYGLLAPCQNLEKTKQEWSGQMGGWTEGGCLM